MIIKAKDIVRAKIPGHLPMGKLIEVWQAGPMIEFGGYVGLSANKEFMQNIDKYIEIVGHCNEKHENPFHDFNASVA